MEIDSKQLFNSLLVVILIVVVLGGVSIFGKSLLLNLFHMQEAFTVQPAQASTKKPALTWLMPGYSDIAEQRKIDLWIDQNHLNKYGDAMGTVYSQRNPLVDPTTGKRTNRYQFIRDHHPDKPWNNL